MHKSDSIFPIYLIYICAKLWCGQTWLQAEVHRKCLSSKRGNYSSFSLLIGRLPAHPTNQKPAHFSPLPQKWKWALEGGGRKKSSRSAENVSFRRRWKIRWVVVVKNKLMGEGRSGAGVIRACTRCYRVLLPNTSLGNPGRKVYLACGFGPTWLHTSCHQPCHPCNSDWIVPVDSLWSELQLVPVIIFGQSTRMTLPICSMLIITSVVWKGVKRV